MDGAFEHQVRMRAYEIWMAEGQSHGHAHEHWVSAERDLMSASVPPATPKKHAPAKKAAALEGVDAMMPAVEKMKAEKIKVKAAPKIVDAKTPRVKVAKDATSKKATTVKKMKAVKADKTVDHGSSAASV